MMQMLSSGGIAALADHVRVSDQDNPRGYYELEKVKTLKQDRTWLPQAKGKAVKVIHLLLMDLPLDIEYRVLFMHRDLTEVTRSQALMLERQGKSGAALGPEKLATIYAAQISTVKQWIRRHSCFSVLDVQYAELVRNPTDRAQEINEFLGGGLNVAAMIGAVDPSLYRNHAGD
jgi:hypothetical protein